MSGFVKVCDCIYVQYTHEAVFTSRAPLHLSNMVLDKQLKRTTKAAKEFSCVHILNCTSTVSLSFLKRQVIYSTIKEQIKCESDNLF